MMPEQYDGSPDYNDYSYYRYPYLIGMWGWWIALLNIENYESLYIKMSDYKILKTLHIGQLKDDHF